MFLRPKKCKEVSPQCPSGQEDAYRLGWYQGQAAMADEHDGSPCQVIRMQQEIDALAEALREIAGMDIVCASAHAWNSLRRIHPHKMERSSE